MTGDEYKGYLQSIEGNSPEINKLASCPTDDELSLALQDDLEEPKKRKKLFSEAILLLGFDVRTFLVNTIHYVCDRTETPDVSKQDMMRTVGDTPDEELTPAINSISSRLAGLLKTFSVTALKEVASDMESVRPQQEQLLAVLAMLSNRNKNTPNVKRLEQLVRCSHDKSAAKFMKDNRALYEEVVTATDNIAFSFAYCLVLYMCAIAHESHSLFNDDLELIKKSYDSSDTVEALLDLGNKLALLVI